jgi:hypothetical protein
MVALIGVMVALTGRRHAEILNLHMKDLSEEGILATYLLILCGKIFPDGLTLPHILRTIPLEVVVYLIAAIKQLIKKFSAKLFRILHAVFWSRRVAVLKGHFHRRCLDLPQHH